MLRVSAFGMVFARLNTCIVYARRKIVSSRAAQRIGSAGASALGEACKIPTISREAVGYNAVFGGHMRVLFRCFCWLI